MTYSLWIDGKAVDGKSNYDVINPADKSVVAKSPQASEAQLEEAIAAANRAFPSWAATPWDKRAELLLKIADELESEQDEFAKLLCQEQGKPLKGYADLGAGFEISGTLAWIRVTAQLTLPIEEVQDNDVARIEVHRRPLGVVGSITPWNYPLLIGIWHIIPALLAGNTVVMKPATSTPLTTIRFAELANRILPAGVFNVIVGRGIGSKMASHKNINKIAFTGSTPTGQSIMGDAAKSNLKRLTLELGGNDAAIVLDDVNVEEVAQKIFATSFINNGQTCAALKRLYVQDGIYEELCQALSNIASRVKTGNGMDETSDFGPMQNENQLNWVKELAEDAKKQGARFLTGGKQTDNTGYYFPITLVADISPNAKLVTEEQFGPILPIIRFNDVTEAIKMANDSPYGLGGSIWTQDIEKGRELASKLECGTVWINNHAMIQPDAPFGGVKYSGFGVEFGVAGLKEFTSIQTMQIHH